MNASDVAIMLGSWLQETYPGRRVHAPRAYDGKVDHSLASASVWSKQSDGESGELVKIVPSKKDPHLVTIMAAVWGIRSRPAPTFRGMVDLHDPKAFDLIKNYIDEAFKACCSGCP